MSLRARFDAMLSRANDLLRERLRREQSKEREDSSRFMSGGPA